MVRDYEEARFLESFIEHLQVLVMPWMLTHTKCDAAKLEVIRDFIVFVIKEVKEDIHAKRGRSKTSWQDRRDDTDYKDLLTRYLKHIADYNGCLYLHTNLFLTPEELDKLDSLCPL